MTILKHQTMNLTIKVSNLATQSFFEELYQNGWDIIKLSMESFETKFCDFLYEKFVQSGTSYELDTSWDNFVEKEYLENYHEYSC